MIDLDAIARRFPLIARPRLACPPLATRVGDLVDLAQKAAGRSGVPQSSQAAAVLNQAALIASDCGLPDLARDWCWQQFHTYQRAMPLDATAARHALEPLVNLVRLSIRAGESITAYRQMSDLFQAVRRRQDTNIDGVSVSFSHLTKADEHHREVCQWLWGVFLAEGARALVGGGHWGEALEHVQRHRGVGQRLLDGRQIAVLTHVLRGDLNAATATIHSSAVEEHWEISVAACLVVLCDVAEERPRDETIHEATQSYLALDRRGPLAVFRHRLALTLLDLIDDSHPAADVIAASLTSETFAEDGYVARDLLTHPVAESFTAVQRNQLRRSTIQCGISVGSIPALVVDALSTAVACSTKIITSNFKNSAL